MTSRYEVKTEKVRTSFGNIYLHADHDGSKVIRVWASAPQKLENTEVGKLIEEMAHGLNRIIKPISEINEEERLKLVREIIEKNRVHA